ncbi:MAG: hypothetical protein R3Y58_00610 [Eubacteriales bacterium]
MLGKLIKHELKASYKLILLAHVFLLITSIIAGLFISAMLDQHIIGNTLMFVLLIAFLVLHFILIGIISMGTLFFIGYRFYKSLFTDEGYLTFTLPTTPNTILHSRLLTGGIWIIFDYLAVILFVGISCYPVLRYPGVLQGLLTLYSIPSALQIISFIVNLVICLFSSVIMLYGCICIGQLLNKNRVLTAIVSYGILTVLVQIISTVYLFSKNLLFASTQAQNFTNQSSSTYATNYFSEIMTFSGVLSFVFGLVFYILCLYIMNKKLNLV